MPKIKSIIRINAGDEYEGRILSIDRTKESQQFIPDVLVNKVVEPSIVRLTDDDCWGLYRGNEWVMSCVERLVRDCVKVIPKIRPKDKTKKVKGRIAQRIKIIEDFLDNPNENKESFADIREKTIRNMLIFGRGAIEKVIDTVRSRKLLEIYAHTPRNLKLRANEHGKLYDSGAYVHESDTGNKDVSYDIDEMIFMVHKPTTENMYGIKTLDGIANSVAADILRAVFNSKFFINGAEAAGLLGLEGMSNSELKKFREYWQNNFKGAKNAHKTAAVNVPVKYVRMAMTNRDLQFSEYGKELRTKIFAGYSMPPFIMGVIDDNTGKLNSGEQVELYKDGALRPILSKEAYCFTKEIIEMGFGFNDIELAFPSIDLIDRSLQATMDREDANAGIIVINEIRATRGLPEVPWGNTPISVMPGGGQVDPNTGRLIPPSKTPTGKPKPKKSLNLFDRYIAQVKLKLHVVLTNANLEEMKSNIKNDMFKIKSFFVNGKRYDLKFYTLPAEIKNYEINDYIDMALSIDEFVAADDARHFYFESLASKIKCIVFENLYNKNYLNSFIEIDKFLYEEMNSEVFNEIF